MRARRSYTSVCFIRARYKDLYREIEEKKVNFSEMIRGNNCVYLYFSRVMWDWIRYSFNWSRSRAMIKSSLVFFLFEKKKGEEKKIYQCRWQSFYNVDALIFNLWRLYFSLVFVILIVYYRLFYFYFFGYLPLALYMITFAKERKNFYVEQNVDSCRHSNFFLS